MKIVYFAAPVRINPSKATELKKEFLHESTRLLMEHDIHVESPHLKYLFTQTHPEYHTESDIDQYARDQGIHLIEEYPIDAVVALTDKEEATDGMRKEAETAEERGIPVHYFPYFTTEGDVLDTSGVNISGLDEILQEI
ncbi:MAG: hypothetical protein SVV03_04010 [Candidatus Nanohaloarchaea archaeon]|nr:hypothetical protein [Candidatus Nanohaloarchaea archaeon]